MNYFSTNFSNNMNGVTKSIVTVVVVLVLMGATNIQSALAQGELTKGFRGGLALSTLHGDDVTGSNKYTTLNAGFFLNYAFNDMFSVQPEINIDAEGANYDMVINSFPYAHARVTYIQVPLLLRLSAGELGDSGVRPSIFAGPAAGAMIYSHLEGVSMQTVDGGYSINQRAEPIAFDVLAGLRATINELYFIDLRLDYGITKAFKREAYEDVPLDDAFKTRESNYENYKPNAGGDVKTGSFEVSIGFKF